MIQWFVQLFRPWQYRYVDCTHSFTFNNGTKAMFMTNRWGESCHVLLFRPKTTRGHFVAYTDIGEQTLRVVANSATGLIEQIVFYPFDDNPLAGGKLTVVALPQLTAVAFIDLNWPEGPEPDLKQVRAHGAIIPADLVPRLVYQAPLE